MDPAGSDPLCEFINGGSEANKWMLLQNIVVDDQPLHDHTTNDGTGKNSTTLNNTANVYFHCILDINFVYLLCLRQEHYIFMLKDLY